jgi:hypothetical protein
MLCRSISAGRGCALILLATFTTACAPGAPPKTGWRPAMGAWFSNDALHLVLDDAHPWTRQEKETLLHQLGHADVVAVGSLHSINQATIYGAAQHLALAFAPAEVLHGSLDAELDRKTRLLVVPVAPSAEAVQLADRIPRRPAGAHYLLLLKRAPRTSGGHQLRWAIYQPTRQLLSHVRSLFSRLHRDGRVARRGHSGSPPG